MTAVIGDVAVRLVLDRWTGSESRALREALRMSLIQFAGRLGVTDRMVSKWEEGGGAVVPRPINQAGLDRLLQLATPDEQARFRLLLGADRQARLGVVTRDVDEPAAIESARTR